MYLKSNRNGRITLLNCYNIGLSGGIPESIGDLTELTQLGLTNNNLTGEIPESIGNLTNLTQLNLANNTLSGSVPDTIGNLNSLTYLILSNNEFSGSIPNSIGELSVLHTLLADSNSFSGSIPSGLCNIENLEISNNQFCDSQPFCIDSPKIMGYQDCSCSNDENKISGYCYLQSDLDVLQDFINNADSLNMIMDTDTLEGVQPLELGFQEWQSGRLKTLDCNWDTISCHLSTEFPVNIINLDSLKYLDLQNNALIGTIPDEISNLSVLEYLDLQDNNLSGYLPESLCIDDTTVWIDINLKNNQFCPCYPECISDLDKNSQNTENCDDCGNGFVQFCTYSENVNIISGDPTCFKESNIVFLDTLLINSSLNEQNSLNMEMDLDSDGIIKQLEIGEQTWAEGRLVQLIANGSGLSGQIPNVIGNLDTLFILYLSNNHLTGPLPESISSMVNLWELNLSNNQLSGEIPESIANLPEITRLQLHNNLFNGYFPERICTDLELDWSDELFSGSSSIFNNQLCPPYPECIAPFVGEQDTTGCE